MVDEPGWGFRLMTVLTLTTGTAFIMWLGEQITERGVGNGMSLIIFAGIVVGFPRAVSHTFQMRTGELSLLLLLLLVALMVAVVAAIIFVERGQRRIMSSTPSAWRPPHVRRAKHPPAAPGEHRRRHPGDLRLLDHRVPATMASCPRQTTPGGDSSGSRSGGTPLYNVLDVTFILFFCYFYTAIVFNPDDVAENMRKYGGFIPGIRPGKKTAEYLDHILSRITLGGALYLALVAIVPEFLITGFKVAPLRCPARPSTSSSRGPGSRKGYTSTSTSAAPPSSSWSGWRWVRPARSRPSSSRGTTTGS